MFPLDKVARELKKVIQKALDEAEDLETLLSLRRIKFFSMDQEIESQFVKAFDTLESIIPICSSKDISKIISIMVVLFRNPHLQDFLNGMKSFDLLFLNYQASIRSFKSKLYLSLDQDDLRLLTSIDIIIKNI